MSAAMRRQRPVTLPAPHGYGGILIERATDGELRECLAKDREYVEAFLQDASQNPHGAQDASSFITELRNPEANRRAIARVAHRIEAVDAELARRREQASKAAASECSDARAWLQGFVDGAPKVVDAYQQRARDVAAAWAVVKPVVDALALLQKSYASQTACVPYAYGEFERSTRAAAHALGVDAPEVPPLTEVPTHDDVQRAIHVLRTTYEDPDLPATGRERVVFQRLIKQAGG